MKKYDPAKIESKWQKYWEKEKMNEVVDGADPSSPKATNGRSNYMLLVEFPYPSGNLHIGHWFAFALPDILARFQRMNGKNVMYPMGFDAFGLPAENAAIQRNISPSDWTKGNIAHMTKQLKSMGATFDWTREVQTIDPNYYKWTQWMFLKFYEKNLAYRAETPVNWCTKDKTVLANEQVVNGKCDRCGTDVEQRKLSQWMFKITEFSDALADGLDKLDWPDTTKSAQKNWIGRSEGSEVTFLINRKFRYVLLHGYTGSPERNFFPWLKKELEKNGHEVIVPELPNTDDPVVMDQVDAIMRDCSFDGNTVLIGHSLGGIDALKVLERISGPIRRTILIGCYAENHFLDENFSEHAFDWKFDVGKIRRNSGRITLLRDLEDTSVPQENTLKLHQLIGGELLDYVAEEPHFCGKIEPAILENSAESIKVFTTRADTLFGATYVVLAPENKMVQDLRPYITNWDDVEKYAIEAKRKSELERMTNVKSKTGVELKGVKAINPINGEEISVWIADYVLAHYGTGAVMAVPAHDQRDYDFAKKQDLEIRTVISGNGVDKKASEEDGILVNSQKFDGLTSEEARKKIVEDLESRGLGKLVKQYRLHDWILSRQRYWGVPIPMIKCVGCGYVPVLEKDLPIKLPKLDDFKPTDDGKSPLAKSEKWLKTKCPKCGGPAERETDTMDTFVDSSWYFMRYTDPNNKDEFAGQKNMDAWLPVPLYIGGAEHNTMHLLYSRFFTKALYSLGFTKFDEPFSGRVNHGIILGPDGQKMSKSRGNVVDPDVEVKNYGADTVRMYLSFMGPYEQGGPWDPKGINGVSRFLNRIWNFVSKYEDKKLEICDKSEINVVIARAIKNVGGDIMALKFNTGVSGLMKMLNSLEEIAGEECKLSSEQYGTILKIIAPYAPHIAEELWMEVLGNKKSIHLEAWPKYDSALLKEETINLVIQVNGRVRDAILMKAGLSEEEVKKLVLASEKIQKFIAGQLVKKFIYIPGRIANIVI